MSERWFHELWFTGPHPDTDEYDRLIDTAADFGFVFEGGGSLSDPEQLAAVAYLQDLTDAVEEYFLWEPGRRGHAAAHRKLAEALRRASGQREEKEKGQSS